MLDLLESLDALASTFLNREELRPLCPQYGMEMFDSTVFLLPLEDDAGLCWFPVAGDRHRVVIWADVYAVAHFVVGNSVAMGGRETI